MLRLLVDEDLSRFMAPALVKAGMEAIDVRDVELRSRPDGEIFAYAQSHRLALLTADQDFASALVYPPGTHCGIVVVSFPNSVHYLSVIQSVVAALRSLAEKEVTGNLVVIEPGRIRIRSYGGAS